MLVSRADRTRRAAFRHAAVAGLFFVFALRAGAASGGDNSAFVAYSNVPMTMKPDDEATVTVTMSNTGTTTSEWSEKKCTRKVTGSDANKAESATDKRTFVAEAWTSGS